MPTTRQAGLSLIELLVALAIGMLLVLGLVEVFAASRAAYQLSAGLARTQENGRFAIDILQRDLRLAGHMGCVNDQARFLPANVTASRPALISTFLTADQQFNAQYHEAPFPLRFDRGIEAYEAVNSASGNTLALSTAPAMAGSTAAWVGGMPAALYSALAGGTSGLPVAGSDVLVLRFMSATGAHVSDFTPNVSTTISFTPGHAQRLTEGVTNPGLFGIGDCMQAAVFNATTVDMAAGTMTVAASSPLNRSGFFETTPFVIGQSTVYRAESVVYYVGLNANGNPALYRLRYALTPNAASIASFKEELVEGIESMQLEFGQDSRTDPALSPTGNISASRPANALLPATDPDTAWRRVGLVRVGLLTRSTEAAAAAQREASVAGLSALGVEFSPPDDGRYRAVYEDSVALRNRLFGN